MSKKLILDFSIPTNLRELWLFHPYFVCKCRFREISMIKMFSLDQSKPILLLYLKIKKFKNLKFVNCTFIFIHKNRNKTSIQPILKMNSTSLIFFVRWILKNVIHLEGECRNCPNFSSEVNYSIYFYIQTIATLLYLLLFLDM